MKELQRSNRLRVKGRQGRGTERESSHQVAPWLFRTSYLQQLSFFHQEGTKSPWPLWGQVTGGVGGCSAGAGPCWRELVLVEVTGARSCSPGAPDTTQHLPQEMQRQHIFPQEVGMKNQGGEEVIRFHSFLLLCYFILLFSYPHVKDRLWHKILIQPGGFRIAFCCEGVGARELSSIALRDTRGKKFWPCRGVLLISCWMWKSSYCITHSLTPVHAQYYSNSTTRKIWYLPLHLALSPNYFLFFSFHFFLPALHPSPCGRPPLLWQLCQCKLLQSVWSGLSPERAVPAGLPIACSWDTQNSPPIGALCLDSCVSSLPLLESLTPEHFQS